MARVNLMAVLLLLVMSFVTSDAHTISYPSSTAVGVDTSSGEDVSTVDVTSTVTDESILTTYDVITSTVNVLSTKIAGTGSTTDGGSGEVFSTADIKSTQNGETSLATDGEPNEVTSTVDAQMSETAGNGQTTDSQEGSPSDVVVTVTSQEGSSPDLGVTSQDGTTPDVAVTVTVTSQDGSSPDLGVTSQGGSSPNVAVTVTSQDGSSPDPGVTVTSQDGSSPDPGVTVTSQDGSTPDVAVTVTSQDGSSPDLGVTSQDGSSPNVAVTVTSQDGSTPDVAVTVTSQAGSSPDLGVTSQDGSSPNVAVTVTSQDGSTPDPGVTVTSQDSSPPDVVVTVTSQDGSSPDVVVTSQDESTAVAGVTTVITEQMTTSSVTVTTPVVTTPTVPSTTTTLPPNHQPPNFDAAPPFLMTFDIGFDKVWNESFSSENCQLNDECIVFRSVVNREVNKAFENCPGYKSNSAMVLSFRQGSESQITQQRMQSSIYLEQNPAVGATVTSNENFTYATYSTSFDNEQILINSALVLNHIDTVAVPYLQTADFDGVGALNESLTNMTIAATSQIDPFTDDACTAIGPYVCSTCFPCIEYDGSAYTISCQSSCEENKICTVTASNTTGCTCKANYLPVAGDCVDQNIIIGVSAGVGGAILLALIIALICVACKLDKKDKDYDHLLKTQEYRPTPYTVAKVHDTERGDDYTVIDGVRHSAASDDGNEIELRSFHNVIETDSASVAAAAVSVHASQHRALDADSHQSNESLAVRSGHVKQELKPDYDNPSLHSVAAVKVMEPSSSSHQLPNQKSNEHYRSLYYPQPSDDDSSKDEDPYAGFVPRLAGVDTQNEYIIARPKYGLQPTTNFKDINSQFF